ncbi:YbjQ family protein [Ichthyenterobacterium magnum]|uniref:Uncharacterized protein YbjQ (UPF0145 family) n=1 Tax=Ichthyenterobacterium magnum TaxID=1230530 RepID=A0A420DX21_9FLAO|nr:heavy metal-binding domain-containing protein [Ichthyenterobacterium magnum]RKE98788.1 uncharacterized protein YbjQ (UPF0145 family) [Ichthyenterobacterium magnum]
MILTTTDSIEGFTIKDYLGIVTGVSVNSKKTSLSFNMEKYYSSLETSINEIKEEAFQNLKQNAIVLKANAIVGIGVDVETYPNTGLIMVSITGTAVKVS